MREHEYYPDKLGDLFILTEFYSSINRVRRRYADRGVHYFFSGDNLAIAARLWVSLGNSSYEKLYLDYKFSNKVELNAEASLLIHLMGELCAIICTLDVIRELKFDESAHPRIRTILGYQSESFALYFTIGCINHFMIKLVDYRPVAVLPNKFVHYCKLLRDDPQEAMYIFRTILLH